MLKHQLRNALIRWGQACGNFALCTMQETLSEENKAIDGHKLNVQKIMD